MAKYYYKGKRKNYKKKFRLLSLLIITAGGIIFLYIFFPFISWQIYFAPSFASQKINFPIPQNSIIASTSVTSLISNATKNIGTDYTNANNWYPKPDTQGSIVANYSISIPKLGIENARVTNANNDLSKSLIQYNSDTIPPFKGNTIIFGHSTLPQLYSPDDYKTIFANAYKLTVGDIVTVRIKNTLHTYKIESVTVVDPDDSSILSQNLSDSFLTLVTCTPPGTVWKRLVIKARLEKT